MSLTPAHSADSSLAPSLRGARLSVQMAPCCLASNPVCQEVVLGPNQPCICMSGHPRWLGSHQASPQRETPRGTTGIVTRHCRGSIASLSPPAAGRSCQDDHTSPGTLHGPGHSDQSARCRMSVPAHPGCGPPHLRGASPPHLSGRVSVARGACCAVSLVGVPLSAASRGQISLSFFQGMGHG